MAERSLRGMKIGANSLETDEGVAFVERKRVVYECPNGHQFGVAMAVEAEPPSTWECRCGAEGELRNIPAPDDKKPLKPQRTHWDMLLERRPSSGCSSKSGSRSSAPASCACAAIPRDGADGAATRRATPPGSGGAHASLPRFDIT